ncbi:MAG TPA: ABC transporter substrate-binding protein [Paracoccaceae bacterium]|nr:ABC transporter substrate-binding protein [Paracoccaceae bacterium]
MRLGLLLSRSGPTGMWTIGCEGAAMLAVAEISAAGGILGREIELVAADPGRSPERAGEAAGELLDRHRVQTVIGMQPSDARRAIRRRLGGRVPCIYTPQYEGGYCGPATVAIGVTDAEVLAPAVAWLASRRRDRRFFFVGNDHIWPRVARGTALEAVAGTGGQVVAAALLPFGLVDHGPVIRRLRRSQADAVICVLLGEEAARFHRVFAEAKLARRMIRLSLALDETLLLAVGPENGENLCAAASFFSCMAAGPHERMLAGYQTAFGRTRPPVNVFSPGCYDGDQLAAALARRAGMTEGPAIARAFGRGFGRPEAFARPCGLAAARAHGRGRRRRFPRRRHLLRTPREIQLDPCTGLAYPCRSSKKRQLSTMPLSVCGGNVAAPRLTEQLSYIIASVNRVLEEELAQRLRPGGISIEQFRILEALAQHETCAMGELASLVLVEPATLTKIIDRMVAEQLVFRLPDERDRRRVKIAMGPAGKALYRRLAGVAAEHERQIARLLDAERAGALRRLLLELKEH